MRYEEITAGQALCDGRRKGYGLACRGTLHRCVACDHTGCKQTYDDMCSNQGFKVTGHCLKCGNRGAQALPA